MRNLDNLLPVGSVVRLEAGEAPVVIIGVCKIYQADEEARGLFFDYSAAVYPDGFDDENLFYFNHENIEEVLFKGLIRPEFERYLKVSAEQLEQLQGEDLFDFGKV